MYSRRTSGTTVGKRLTYITNGFPHGPGHGVSGLAAKLIEPIKWRDRWFSERSMHTCCSWTPWKNRSTDIGWNYDYPWTRAASSDHHERMSGTCIDGGTRYYILLTRSEPAIRANSRTRLFIIRAITFTDCAIGGSIMRMSLSLTTSGLNGAATCARLQNNERRIMNC